MNPADKIPALLGAAGTAVTFSLSQVNDLLGCLAGVLTVALLLRQHAKLDRKKK